MNYLVDKALEYASEKHKGQLDDADRPYFFAHLAQVHSILKDVTDDEEILVAGILHDVLEDTQTSYEELETEFTPNIATIVNMVSHDKDTSAGSARSYFPRLIISKNKYYTLEHKAILVKFADRLSNLSRMQSWNDKRKNQYMRKSQFWTTE